MLNRAVLIKRPKQPFLDRAAQPDDFGVIPDVGGEQNVCLIPGFEDDDEARRVLEVAYAEVVERHLGVATLATSATQEPQTGRTVATVATVAGGDNLRDGPTAFAWRVRTHGGWREVRFVPPANRSRVALHYPGLEAAPMPDDG